MSRHKSKDLIGAIGPFALSKYNTFEEILQKVNQGKRSYIEPFAKTANGS